MTFFSPKEKRKNVSSLKCFWASRQPGPMNNNIRKRILKAAANQESSDEVRRSNQPQPLSRVTLAPLL